MVLAHRIATDAVTREVAHLLQPLERLDAQIQMHAALHDTEERLVRASMRLVAALRPTAREIHGALHVAALRRVTDALVELHADVGAELLRDGHVVFGAPEHVAAVVVGGDETHALVRELHGVGVAEDLEPTRIGEDGAVPVHEAVETAHLVDEVRAGAHGQVVGVREDDLRAQVLDRLPRHALHRGARAHRHEDGCLDVAVRRVQHARARMRLGIFGDDVVGE